MLWARASEVLYDTCREETGGCRRRGAPVSVAAIFSLVWARVQVRWTL